MKIEINLKAGDTIYIPSMTGGENVFRLDRMARSNDRTAAFVYLSGDSSVGFEIVVSYELLLIAVADGLVTVSSE